MAWRLETRSPRWLVVGRNVGRLTHMLRAAPTRRCPSLRVARGGTDDRSARIGWRWWRTPTTRSGSPTGQMAKSVTAGSEISAADASIHNPLHSFMTRRARLQARADSSTARESESASKTEGWGVNSRSACHISFRHGKALELSRVFPCVKVDLPVAALNGGFG